MTEFSVKDLVDRYYSNDNELLKHALVAKAEEDKKQTAKDTLKIEQARIYLKHLDFELLRHNGAPRPTPITHSPSRKGKHHLGTTTKVHKLHIDSKRLYVLPKLSRYHDSYLISPQSSTTLKPVLPPIDTTRTSL